MPKREDIFAAADRLVADRRPVSVRAVRAELPGRGSLGAIAPVLKQWRQERAYRPALSELDLSDDLCSAIAHLVSVMREESTSGLKDVSRPGRSAAVQGRPRSLRGRLVAVLWDGILDEVHKQLVAPTSTEAIVRGLDPEVERLAEALGTKVTQGRLATMIRSKGTESGRFQEVSPGIFSRAQ